MSFRALVLVALFILTIAVLITMAAVVIVMHDDYRKAISAKKPSVPTASYAIPSDNRLVAPPPPF